MRYDRLLTKLFRSPLLLDPNTRAGFEGAMFSLMQGKIPDPLSLRSPMDGRRREQLEEAAFQYEAKKTLGAQTKRRAERHYDPGHGTNGRVALIHVDGVLDRHISQFELDCFGGCDVDDVGRAVDFAETDKGTEHVLLYINSPGGSVSGIPETADKIARLAAKKDVFVFVDTLCASAGYWLASQADQIFAGPSAQVGSVGVYLALLDESRLLEEMGVKIETIKDGKLKAAGAWWKPLSEDERAHFQASVLEIGTMFRGAVNKKRPGVSLETMQGQCFFGASAQKVGLVDAIVPDVAAAVAEFYR
jgi:signal peptide peptidase SppA